MSETKETIEMIEVSIRSVLQASYKGIALAGAVPQGFLLDALAALLESIDSEMDDVEGIHDRDRLW